MRKIAWTVTLPLLLIMFPGVLLAQTLKPVADGTYGDVVVDGDSAFPTAGVVLKAGAARPSIAAQLAASDASAGFIVFNASNLELLRVRSDGNVGIGITAPRSRLHIVRSLAGLGPELILENNAGTINDAEALTFSSYGAPRAQIFSGLDTSSAAGTFVFKTGVNTLLARMTIGASGDTTIDGGAYPLKLISDGGLGAEFQDLYYSGASNGIRLSMSGNSEIVVSGMRIGFFTQPVIESAAAALQLNRISGKGLLVGGSVTVENLKSDVELLLSAGDEPSDPNSATLTFMRKDGNDVQIVKYGWRLDANDGNKLKLLRGGSGDYTATALSIDSTGMQATGNLNVTGVVTGTEIRATYQDVAEWVPSRSDLAPGTVVILDEVLENGVMASHGAYDTRVAGVVSQQPGILLGEGGAGKEQIATTGRVRVKVDATHAPIAVGDLLVTSDRPGFAMKSQPIDLGGVAIHRPGTIVGKALQPLQEGEGEILVLLSLQ